MTESRTRCAIRGLYDVVVGDQTVGRCCSQKAEQQPLSTAVRKAKEYG